MFAGSARSPSKQEVGPNMFRKPAFAHWVCLGNLLLRVKCEVALGRKVGEVWWRKSVAMCGASEGALSERTHKRFRLRGFRASLAVMPRCKLERMCMCTYTARADAMPRRWRRPGATSCEYHSSAQVPRKTSIQRNTGHHKIAKHPHKTCGVRTFGGNPSATCVTGTDRSKLLLRIDRAEACSHMQWPKRTCDRRSPELWATPRETRRRRRASRSPSVPKLATSKRRAYLHSRSADGTGAADRQASPDDQRDCLGARQSAQGLGSSTRTFRAGGFTFLHTSELTPKVSHSWAVPEFRKGARLLKPTLFFPGERGPTQLPTPTAPASLLQARRGERTPAGTVRCECWPKKGLCRPRAPMATTRVSDTS